MTFKYKKAIVNHKGTEYTICIPEYEFQNTYLNELDRKDFYITSSKEEYKELSFAMYFMSQSSNAVLYISPIKKSRALCPRHREYSPPTLDLICTSQSMQLSQKEWKDVFRRASKSVEHCTMKISDNDLAYSDMLHFYNKNNRDYLDIYRSDSALMLMGSMAAYYYIAYTARELSNCQYSSAGLAGNHLSHLFRVADGGHQWQDLAMYLSEPKMVSSR